MINLRSPGRVIGWRVFQALTVAGFGYAAWRLLGHLPYRIDIEVYRMGGRAWLDRQPLYSDGAIFHTRIGLDLPFTYPPLAAIAFSPFAWLSFPVASVAITLTTLVLLVISTVMVLTRLEVWPTTPDTQSVTREPAWLRRSWLALAIVAAAVVYLEPIWANFDFGQINVVLMTLVIADCVPRRTPWPRGLLLGLAIALKLTPAVFLVYFVLRRDGRAALTAVISFLVTSLAGFALAWRDSWEYWGHTLGDTGRIGDATLNTNQNIAGALARLGLSDGPRSVLWVLACLLVLAGTVWATRRILRAPQTGPQTGAEPVLALMCIALFGLVVSPVSWSHHWVWALPTVVVTTVLAYRQRNAALGLITAVGIALMVWVPLDLMPKHHEAAASWWRQLVGGSYVWWALAVIAIAGLTAGTSAVSRRQPEESGPAADRARRELHRL